MSNVVCLKCQVTYFGVALNVVDKLTSIREKGKGLLTSPSELDINMWRMICHALVSSSKYQSWLMQFDTDFSLISSSANKVDLQLRFLVSGNEKLSLLCIC